MITRQFEIRPISTCPVAPIEMAALCYLKWNGDVPFIQDLADHLLHGVVIARPDLFGMAKVIDLDGEPAWFVRMAVGNLVALLAALPCHLPKICFCRRGDGRVRTYSLDRLLKLAARRKGGN